MYDYNFALFSLPSNLFCVDNVKRTVILINWLELRWLRVDSNIFVRGAEPPILEGCGRGGGVENGVRTPNTLN